MLVGKASSSLNLDGSERGINALELVIKNNNRAFAVKLEWCK